MKNSAQEPSIELRSVRPDDEAFLRALHASTREEELAQVPWNDAQKSAFLEMQFRAQSADYTSRFPDAAHSIVLVDGDAAGRVWIDRGDDEILLIDVALLTDKRGGGIGTTLLRRLQAEATESGRPLRHSVHADNTEARRFYEALGFSAVKDFGIHVLMEWIPDAGPSDGSDRETL